MRPAFVSFLLLLLVASSEVTGAEEPAKSETQKPARKTHLEVAGSQRPVLQIINGSEQPIEVYWLKSDDERVSNLSVEPGKDSLITPTLRGPSSLSTSGDVLIPVRSRRHLTTFSPAS